MSPQKNKEDSIDETRKHVQDELGRSQHALADGILCLTHDMNGVKNEVKTMGDTVSKLYKVVAGDPEFGTDGLIQHNEASKARHKDTMDKVSFLNDSMGVRVDKVEDKVDALEKKVDMEITKMKTIGAVIVIGWGLLGEFIKSFFHK